MDVILFIPFWWKSKICLINMIVTDINKRTKELKKSIKKNIVTFLWFQLSLAILNTLYIFLFFYLEECYDVVLKKAGYSARHCLLLCQTILELNETLPHNNAVQNLTGLCTNEDFCDEKEHVSDCSISFGILVKWYEYVFTISHTIGKHKIIIPHGKWQCYILLFYFKSLFFIIIMNRLGACHIDIWIFLLNLDILF